MVPNMWFNLLHPLTVSGRCSRAERSDSSPGISLGDWFFHHLIPTSSDMMINRGRAAPKGGWFHSLELRSTLRISQILQYFTIWCDVTKRLAFLDCSHRSSRMVTWFRIIPSGKVNIIILNIGKSSWIIYNYGPFSIAIAQITSG